ncbi:hypothetical protein [Solitalea koreensis]|uniref:Uncharacterized protein n=1 Tax=Solitalea koreensis TaxID=543615 RepID=A0A521AE17_9SPHI|nr:hypothetical protein [Solitalea koreensis]SMO32940.1 hypothetical protein SAMN06265350_10176 [Solitalea koreensis]
MNSLGSGFSARQSLPYQFELLSHPVGRLKRAGGLNQCFNIAFAQNYSPVLKINDLNYTIKIPDRINNYLEFNQILNHNERDSLEAQFVPYLINYIYSGRSKVYFFNFSVKSLAASVNKNKEISAVHIVCNYSPLVL